MERSWGFKGLQAEPKSASPWYDGTGRQAGRDEVLAEMCSVRPGKANPLGQVSAEGLGFWSVHFEALHPGLKSTGEEGEWSEPWKFWLTRKGLEN